MNVYTFERLKIRFVVSLIDHQGLLHLHFSYPSIYRLILDRWIIQAYVLLNVPSRNRSSVLLSIERVSNAYQTRIKRITNTRQQRSSIFSTSAWSSVRFFCFTLFALLYYVRPIKRFLKFSRAPLCFLQRSFSILLRTRRVCARIACGVPLGVPRISSVVDFVIRTCLLLRLFTSFPLHSSVLEPNFYLNSNNNGFESCWDHRWVTKRATLVCIRRERKN